MIDRVASKGQAKGWTIADMKRDWRVVYVPKMTAAGRQNCPGTGDCANER